MPFEPRRPPTETVEGLSPPYTDFPYFEHADALAFRPGDRAYSPVNAWWLADSSMLVYDRPESVEAMVAASPLAGQGYRLDWLGSRDDNRGMTLSNDESLIVVFRGTRIEVRSFQDVAEVALLQQDDLWVDVQLMPAVHRAGGRVHRGFLTAFAEVADSLDAVVRERRPGQALWLAGHSLGGALATLAAAHVGREAVQGLYTFGAPRVGDPAFTAVLPVESHYRLVHREDWVPRLPPRLLGYAHAGVARAVSGGPPRDPWNDFKIGANDLKAALAAMAREKRFQTRDLPFKIGGISDHMPIYYATLLWNAVAAKA